MPASHDAARHRSTRSPVPEHQQATACVRVRSFAIVIGPASPPVPASTHGGDCSLSRMIGDDRQVTVRFLPDGELARPMLSRSSDSLTLVLGDDAETSDLSGRACMANALSVECDFARRTVRAFASIVGLPPLFLRRSPGKTQLTSDISLLAQPGERLELDQLGVLDLFRVGYPTEYRTLFKDVELAPGGHELRIDQHAAVTMRRAWRLPESEQPLDWPAFLDHQAGAFKAAIRNLDLSASFFALTGGYSSDLRRPGERPPHSFRSHPDRPDLLARCEAGGSAVSLVRAAPSRRATRRPFPGGSARVRRCRIPPVRWPEQP